MFDKSILANLIDQQSLIDDRVKDGLEQRKGRFQLYFHDAEHKPIPGVKVELKQLTHAFNVGANIFMLDEMPDEERNRLYKEHFVQTFNTATVPFYWHTLEPEQGKPRYSKDSPKIYRRPPTDLCVEFCEEHGIMPKCHCLNYPAFMPPWAMGDINYEKRCLSKRMAELAQRYSTRIRDWEVTNESWWPHTSKPMGSLYRSHEYVEWSFQEAAKHFPGNRLIINESSQIWTELPGYNGNYYMQIERALLKGARIDAIGMQFHLFHREEKNEVWLTHFLNPTQLYSFMDHYATLGRPIQLTEVTLPAYRYTDEAEEIQAEILRQLYRIWFSHPAVDGIIYWNLVDGFAHGTVHGDMTSGENYYHGGLIRYDMTPKPALKVLQQLFKEEFRSNFTGTSFANGYCHCKLFDGDYQLTYTTPDGRTGSKRITITRQQPPVLIQKID